jgi:hypothetical protein
MTIQVLQRPYWDGQPKHQADWFRLHKERREAVCAMFSHQSGGN